MIFVLVLFGRGSTDNQIQALHCGIVIIILIRALDLRCQTHPLQCSRCLVSSQRQTLCVASRCVSRLHTLKPSLLIVWYLFRKEQRAWFHTQSWISVFKNIFIECWAPCMLGKCPTPGLYTFHLKTESMLSMLSWNVLMTQLYYLGKQQY